jgi:tetrahydromethanopterin S-methyltransferase subunit A
MQSAERNTREKGRDRSWPVVEGSYMIGDPMAPVAVCTLTSDELVKPLATIPGVAIAGEVQTANAGIERIILNVTANSSIRFFLLCGKDSRLFRQGQSLRALIEHSVDAEKRIVGAQGYEPVLRNLPLPRIETFRRQIELVDWSGERDVQALRERIQSLAARTPGRFMLHWDNSEETMDQPQFTVIRPGGQREPLIYDPTGYFVITLDRPTGVIVLRHYLPDHAPAHEMRGRSAESMLLGLLREGLVSQLSHAGYLGIELAKAEAALRLGTNVRYEQDRPLRLETSAPEDAGNVAPRMPALTSSQNWEQLKTIPVGGTIDIAVEVTAQPAQYLLEEVLAEPAVDDPMRSFRRTDHPLRIHWSPDTQVAMGTPDHFGPGALLRVHGTLQHEGEVAAELIAVLTRVAQVN